MVFLKAGTIKVDEVTSSALTLSSTSTININAISPINIDIVSTDTSGTEVKNILSLIHEPSGTVDIGVGTGIEFITKTGTSNNEIGSIIESVTTDVSGGNENFDLIFKNMLNGSIASESLRISSSGNMILKGNGSSSNSDKPGSILLTPVASSSWDSYPTILGIDGTLQHSGIKTAGVQYYLTIDNNTSADNVDHIYISSYTNIGSTTNWNTSLNINTPNITLNGNTLNNNAGIYIADMNSGATNNYSIYIADSQLYTACAIDSSSPTTGSMVTLGGVGITKNLYVGEDITVTGNIISSTAPTLSSHLTNKEYVDNVAAGLDTKQACRVATTEDLSGADLSGNNLIGPQEVLIIDSVTVILNDRILVKNQTNANENGIFYVSQVGVNSTTEWILTRATDFDNSPVGEVNGGEYTFITEGSTYGDTGWVVTTPDLSGNFIINIDDIIWAQFTGGATVTAGAGLTKDGTVLNVGAGTGIIVDATNVNIDTTVVATTTNTLTMSNKTLTSVDINGGTIDGVSIGASSAGTGIFTTLTITEKFEIIDGSSNLVIDDVSGNSMDGDFTINDNLTVVGSVTISSGNIDGTTIGNTTPAVGNFTDVKIDDSSGNPQSIGIWSSWTPTDDDINITSFTNINNEYFRIADAVTLHLNFTVDISNNTNEISIGGLPILPDLSGNDMTNLLWAYDGTYYIWCRIVITGSLSFTLQGSFISGTTYTFNGQITYKGQ